MIWFISNSPETKHKLSLILFALTVSVSWETSTKTLLLLCTSWTTGQNLNSLPRFQIKNDNYMCLYWIIYSLPSIRFVHDYFHVYVIHIFRYIRSRYLNFPLMVYKIVITDSWIRFRQGLRRFLLIYLYYLAVSIPWLADHPVRGKLPPQWLLASPITLNYSDSYSFEKNT